LTSIEAGLTVAGEIKGGLLVGARGTQRSDLFGACLSATGGVMGRLRFNKFTIGWARMLIRRETKAGQVAGRPTSSIIDVAANNRAFLRSALGMKLPTDLAGDSRSPASEAFCFCREARTAWEKTQTKISVCKTSKQESSHCRRHSRE
jgi:hypothetical protein